MLRPGGFLEGRELAQNGIVDISLPDDDPDALKIILQIVHVRHRDVPQKIVMDLMLKVLILADKYQMVGCLAGYTKSWLQGIGIDPDEDEPEPDEDKLIGWLTISWILELPAHFRFTTLALILENKGDVAELLEELPIPQSLISMLHQTYWKYTASIIRFPRK